MQSMRQHPYLYGGALHWISPKYASAKAADRCREHYSFDVGRRAFAASASNGAAGGESDGGHGSSSGDGGGSINIISGGSSKRKVKSRSVRDNKIARAVDAGRRAGLLQAPDGPSATAATSGLPDRRMQQREDILSWLCELLQCNTAADKARLCKRGHKLLTLSPDDLQERLQNLVQLFGGAEAAAKRACRRQPRLLECRLATVRRNMTSLGELLHLTDSPRLTRIVCSCPDLLYRKPATLHSKLHALSELLGSKEEAVRVCQLQPSLLCLSSGSLHSKVQQLAEVFGLQLIDVQHMCATQPSILMSSPITLIAKVCIVLDQHQSTVGACPNRIQRCFYQCSAPVSLCGLSCSCR